VIATLRGRVTHVLDDGAVIEVGGVGYRVHLTAKALATLPRHGDVLVHTHTYVREDALALYAFPTAAEHHAFELLLGASGVGPKLALAILGTYAPDALWAAVRAGDADALTRVPGVGRKGAQRLLLELRNRIGDADALPPAAPGAAPVYTEVREALTALGYAPAEIKEAMDALPADAAGATTAELVKHALRALSGTVRG
jgi:Holliday junction DNA helicase RuvA